MKILIAEKEKNCPFVKKIMQFTNFHKKFKTWQFFRMNFYPI